MPEWEIKNPFCYSVKPQSEVIKEPMQCGYYVKII